MEQIEQVILGIIGQKQKLVRTKFGRDGTRVKFKLAEKLAEIRISRNKNLSNTEIGWNQAGPK